LVVGGWEKELKAGLIPAKRSSHNREQAESSGAMVIASFLTSDFLHLVITGLKQALMLSGTQ